MSDGPQPRQDYRRTNGGAYVEGNVRAGRDFIGRDSIATQINNFFQGNLDPTQLTRARNILIGHVRKFWIEGVLNKSLYREVLLTLGMENRPGMVDNRPWDMILQTPHAPDRTLPAGTKIIDVFDQCQHSLLILGTPGAGKTTTLLELARDLFERVDHDITYPIPVVFNLSSWAVKRPPLADWLIDELNKRYYIGRRTARHWVEYDALLLLLDGLDEVQQQYRDQCIDAINKFRQNHMVSLVVCSRLADYEAQKGRLHLQEAVLLQPLALNQVDDYLQTFEPDYAPLRQALTTDWALQELAKSPLLLSIIMIAYQGTGVILSKKAGATTLPRQHLFSEYIQRMFARRLPRHSYTPEQTLWWLHCLASGMNEHRQVIFLIERLQPIWLGKSLLIQVYRIMFGLVFGLMFGMIVRRIPGMIFGVAFGMIIGSTSIQPVEKLMFERRLDKLLLGLLISLLCGVVFGLRYELRIGLIFWLILGPIFGLALSSIRVGEASEKTQPNQGIWNSAKIMLGLGLSACLLFGLVFMLSLSLSVELSVWLIVWLSVWLSILLMVGPSGMLIYGGLACVQHIVLRFTLWHYNLAPFNYAKFLDHCVERIFLRRVGGGYIFIHRLLLEHFAVMTQADIDELVKGIKVG